MISELSMETQHENHLRTSSMASEGSRNIIRNVKWHWWKAGEDESLTLKLFSYSWYPLLARMKGKNAHEAALTCPRDKNSRHKISYF